MRYYYFLIYGIILISISCSKDNDELTIEKKIIGKWNWIESNGGFTGHSHYTPENTGTVTQLIFSKEKTVYKIMNKDTIHKTNYYISKENSILFGDSYDFLIINYRYDLPDTTIYLPMRYIIRNISDELILDEDVYDGYIHRFERIKN